MAILMSLPINIDKHVMVANEGAGRVCMWHVFDIYQLDSSFQDPTNSNAKNNSTIQNFLLGHPVNR